MRRVAVIGLGITTFGKHERTSAELFAAAAAEAIADADVAPGAIGGDTATVLASLLGRG